MGWCFFGGPGGRRAHGVSHTWGRLVALAPGLHGAGSKGGCAARHRGKRGKSVCAKKRRDAPGPVAPVSSAERAASRASRGRGGRSRGGACTGRVPLKEEGVSVRGKAQEVLPWQTGTQQMRGQPPPEAPPCVGAGPATEGRGRPCMHAKAGGGAPVAPTYMRGMSREKDNANGGGLSKQAATRAAGARQPRGLAACPSWVRGGGAARLAGPGLGLKRWVARPCWGGG
jgi:hypothetical protein